MKVRIKIGATVSHQGKIYKWPQCSPPKSEHQLGVYKEETAYPHAEFTAEREITSNGAVYWICSREGYQGVNAVMVLGEENVEEASLDANDSLYEFAKKQGFEEGYKVGFKDALAQMKDFIDYDKVAAK